MRYLKIAIIVFVALLLLPAIVAAFLPREYKVEREISIEKPQSEVFDFIKYLKNQDLYSSWAEMDPNMETYYKGEDGKPGFIAGWKSEMKNVGSGEQEILNIIPNQRIDFKIRFLEPFQSEDKAYMTVHKINNQQTLVKWGFSGSMEYPSNILLLLMNMEEMIGKDLDKSLKKLKIVLEEKP